MNFTKQDIQKIAAALKQLSVKDSQFAQVKPITNTNNVSIPVLQNNENRLLALNRLLELATGDITSAELTINGEKRSLVDILNYLYEHVGSSIPVDENGNPIDDEGDPIQISSEYISYNDSNVHAVIDSILESVQGYVELNSDTGLLDWETLPPTVLDTIIGSENSSDDIAALDYGAIYAYDGGVYEHTDNEEDTFLGDASSAHLYYVTDTGYLYRYADGEWRQTVAFDASRYLQKNSHTQTAEYSSIPSMVLHNITGQTHNAPAGSWVFFPAPAAGGAGSLNSSIQTAVIRKIYGSVNTLTNYILPSSNVLYYCLADSKFYRYTGAAMQALSIAGTEGGGGGTIEIDSELDPTSTNAIQNQAVANRFAEVSTELGLKANESSVADRLNAKQSKLLVGSSAVASEVDTTPSLGSNHLITSGAVHQGLASKAGAQSLFESSAFAFSRIVTGNSISFVGNEFVYNSTDQKFHAAYSVDYGTLHGEQTIEFSPNEYALYFNKADNTFYKKSGSGLVPVSLAGVSPAPGISGFNVETEGDGIVTITAGDDVYNINLNHSHPQYLKAKILASAAAFASETTEDDVLYVVLSTPAKIYLGSVLLSEAPSE